MVRRTLVVRGESRPIGGAFGPSPLTAEVTNFARDPLEVPFFRWRTATPREERCLLHTSHDSQETAQAAFRKSGDETNLRFGALGRGRGRAGGRRYSPTPRRARRHRRRSERGLRRGGGVVRAEAIRSGFRGQPLKPLQSLQQVSIPPRPFRDPAPEHCRAGIRWATAFVQHCRGRSADIQGPTCLPIVRFAPFL